LYAFLKKYADGLGSMEYIVFQSYGDECAKDRNPVWTTKPCNRLQCMHGASKMLLKKDLAPDALEKANKSCTHL